jgi:RHS repeat-associated protein
MHDYLPFGPELTSTKRNEPKLQDLKFTGHERDEFRDRPPLDYMHARYSEPRLGRFLSVDPVIDWKKTLSNPQMWNRYGYVSNNPLRFTDPTGREADPGELGTPEERAAWGNAIGEFVTSMFHVEELRQASRGAASAPLNERMMIGAIGLLAGIDIGSSFIEPGKGAAIEGGTTLAKHSFTAFKRSMGAAGANMHWHHIVEQTARNTATFGGQALNNLTNVIRIDAKTHAKISAFYSSKIKGLTGNLTVREWLSKKSFKEQYEFGLKVLRDNGVIR